jgi:hypothetical protein
MRLCCGYALDPEEQSGIADVWLAFDTDAASVAVCTAPLEAAHRHVFVVAACGGFSRVKVEGTTAGVASFLQHFDADAAPGMFALDRALAPLDQTVTKPLFSARHVDDPDLVVVVLEPTLFTMVNVFAVNRIRRLVVGKPVLLLCWWYPVNDELLKVALHDVFGTKNIFSPKPQRAPRLCAGCPVRRTDASGGAAANLQLLRSSGDILLQNVRKTVQNAPQASFDAAFNLLKTVHNNVATLSKCHATLDAAIEDGESVVLVSEFAHIHDHVVRAFKKQTRFSFQAFTKAMVFDTTKLAEAGGAAPGASCGEQQAAGQRVRVLFADAFFVERDFDMCLHLLMQRFPVSSADVFTWTCDADRCVSRDWSPTPTMDVVISALRCFL